MPSTVSLAEPSWLSLFNARAFHALNGSAPDATAAAHEEDGRVVCVLSGVLADGVFESGRSAPFGGLDFARGREAPGRVVTAVERTLAEIERQGAHTIRIRCRGASWSANEAVVHFALLNRGFRVEVADLSYALDLRPYASAEDYVAALRSPARRALRHGRAEPFAFAEAGDWARPHAILAENRRARGRTLALDLAYLEQARSALPGRVRLFELRHDGVLCAAALVFVVTPERWYVQAWGDAFHALPRSPMNVLVLRLVETALAAGVEVMDLGRTTEDAPPGRPLPVGEGLAQFKQSIGAQAELRPVLVR